VYVVQTGTVIQAIMICRDIPLSNVMRRVMVYRGFTVMGSIYKAVFEIHLSYHE
jgi:hypothetical protein